MRYFRALFLLGWILAFGAQAQKQMVVTVDDLPAVTDYYRTPQSWMAFTRQLVGHLTTHRVPAVGFVISGFLYRDSTPDTNQLNLLNVWLDAGLELGNHSRAHKDYNQITFAEFSQDVVGGEQLTKSLVERRGKSFRYFRHPFLHRGNTAAKKDSLEQFIKQRGYREAPVTIDNSDYVFASAYDKALLAGDTGRAADIGRQYVAYMLHYVDYYESQSGALFGRLIPQILLLHANTINATYLGDLLTGIQQKGYAFVTLDEALNDKAYQTPDNFVSQSGISWIHRWALTQGKRGAFFKGEPEVPAVIAEWAAK